MPRQRIDLDAVVSSAISLADSEGLDGVALGRVAEDLGVQASALYNHVDGVDGLRNALSTQSLGNLSDSLRDAAVARSGEDALHEVAHAYRSFAHEHPGQYASTLAPPDGTGDRFVDDHRAITDLFEQILRAFDIVADEAVHTARALRSAIHGFVALESIDAFSQPQALDSSFDHLIKMVIAGARATAP